jgi:Flp pilus assembly protein TadG
MVKRRRKQGGQALVEIALVLPILLMVLMGIIDFGRVFHGYLTVTNAARTAVRQAAVGVSDTMVIQTARDSAGSLDVTQLNVSITPTQFQRYPGNSVTVVVSYNLSILTPIMRSFMPNPFTINGKAVMILE